MPIVDPFKSQQTGGIVDPFKTKTEPEEPTETGGFFGSFKQALKERTTTAAPAAQLYLGAGDQRAATDELLRAKEEASAVYKQTEFSDIGKAFKEGRFGDALGDTLNKFKEVAGASLGSQTPAIAAGLGTRAAVAGGAALLGVAAAPAALLGTAAWGLTTLGSYIADNLSRQKEEQEKKGKKYEDVNRMTATAAATGQTALDAFGFSYFKPLGRLVGFSGKESAEKATLEIVQAATNPNAYKKAIASGAAAGIAFEIPQEVSQQVLERWQAGLALNPFTDPEAAKEYLEAAGGALLLGGPMGAYSKGVNTYRARQTPEAQVMLRDMEGGAAQDIGGEPNVNKPISPPSGAGTQVSGERGAGTATGTNVAQPSGVDDAGQTTAGPAGGTTVQSGALTEPPGLLDNMPGDGTPAETLPFLAPQNVDEYAARTQQGLRDANDSLGNTDTVSAKYGNENFAPASNLQEPPGLFGGATDTATATPTTGSLSALRDAYTSLKQEISEKFGRGDTRLVAPMLRDLTRMIDENAGLIRNQTLINNLKNPMFDGTQQLSDLVMAEQTSSGPKAMQSKLFGEGQSKDEKVEPIDPNAKTIDMYGVDKTPDIGNRDETLTFENQEAFETYQDRLKRSAAGEKRNKAQAGAASPTMSAQERLDLLTARETDLARSLQKSTKEYNRLNDLAARPVEERIQRPTAETRQKAFDIAKGYERELTSVRKDIEAARVEAATAKPAPTVKKVAPEQVDMFGKPVVEKQQQQKAEKSKSQETKKAKEAADELLGKKKRKAPTSIAEDFEEFGADVAEDEKSEAETQRETQEKEAAQKTAEAKQAEEDKDAPDTSTEHVDKTEEAQAIKRFLNAVNLAARPKSKEANKITSLKDVIYKLLSRFDITRPGEKSSSGLKAAFKFLVDIAGGETKFDKLVTSLQNPGTMSQAQLLERAGFPNITTRRGLEEFKDQVQNFINALGAKGQKVKIESGKVAYESDVEVETKRAMTPGVTPEGKIRRPSMEGGTKQFKVSDTKLRSAWTTLKQMFDSGGNVTPEMLAAKAYITNPTRPKFGFVLADLAYDLARWDAFLEAQYGMRAADVKEMTAAERKKLPRTAEQAKLKTDFGRNATFFGEGGAYAESFQRWIEQNLDPKTIATLNEMVANERANMDEEIKFNKAVTLFNLEVQKRKTASAQARIATAEKVTNQQLRLDKRKQAKETAAAVEGIETEGEDVVMEAPVDLRNLPTKQKLHPAVVRAIEAGDLKGALKIMAGDKTNGYFKDLAQRLLEAGLTAKTKVMPQSTIESLKNDPQIKETLDNQLRALRDMVETSLPEAQRGELLSALSSKNLFDINAAVIELKDTLTNESQLEIVNETQKLLDDQFNWDAKYDPDTDILTMRRGMMDNNVFFHEALHAATIHLIDNPDKLSGERKQAYNRLLELYNYSKGTLASEHLGNYGLKDLHEFVSEGMSNPDFQALLRGMRYKSATFSLWNEFTTAITKLFKTPSKEESDVMVEVMRATNILMAGPMAMDSMTGTKSTPKAMSRIALKAVPAGMSQPTPATISRLMTPSQWNEIRRDMPYILSTATSSTRPQLLGALTLRQIDDLVRGRIPQVSNFIRVMEVFLSRKNNILRESGEISQRWEEMQRKYPEMSRMLARVMHAATIKQFDPDQDPKIVAKNNYTAAQKAENQDITDMWLKLTPEAKKIYRDVRGFYESRYSEYKDVLNDRIATMKAIGVTDKKIANIREEFEKTRQRGPYFPLMRHGRFWYQVGENATREYYMFETQGQKEKHLEQRLKKNPELEKTLKGGSTYKGQMDLHAAQSQFLQNSFEAIDSATFKGSEEAIELQKQVLKDSIYQNYLSNQPEQSFRKAFINRNNIAGYSEDALRNFARSSFHMAYQLSRFENSPGMFLSVQEARKQIKGRFDANKGYDVKLARENTELTDYVTEMENRLGLMLNPTDQFNLFGFITPSLLSNIGFIWYLTAPASAITNVLGGAIIGVPTLVGMNLRMNPGMSYAQATVNALWQTKKAASQIISTGFGNKKDGYFPSMGRYKGMTDVEKQAYDRFVGDGLIDITATYDQSGLAAASTGDQFGVAHKGMQLMTGLFHNAERFNREVMSMSAFRQAMDARKDRKDKDAAFEEAVLAAKDVTHRAMFDYSSANKPRFFQHPVASVILQFKQFPQQMTFFLAHNFINMYKGESVEVRREARARFIGTMGMAGIFSGVTGLWGFSTVASVMNAVVNGLSDEEEPFDFELEFINWAINTFGVNMGTMITRGIGNAAGIDIASRTKLDDMWFRDRRKNQDEVEALQSFLVDLLGPTVGLTVTAARATQLWNEGHADRAIEAMLPAFAKAPMTAIRYGKEGANTLKGDPLMEEMGPFYLLMQSLGIRNAELAERQFYNIQIKGQEQAVKKERDNLLNLFALGFMSGDSDTAEKALDKIYKFNDKHTSMAIPADSITKSILDRMKKSAQTDHGLYIDKKMRGVLGGTDYMSAISDNNEDED